MNIGGDPYKGRGSSSSKAIDYNNNAAAADPLDAAHDTVGSLLAAIANSINGALHILMFADKRHWGPDEFEQVRALEDALDEAKEDFQQLGPLLKGSFYYENDRKRMLQSTSPLYAYSPWDIGVRAAGPADLGSRCHTPPLHLVSLCHTWILPRPDGHGPYMHGMHAYIHIHIHTRS